MSSIQKKLEQLGYSKTTTAIMIPLSILKSWTDQEIIELKNTENVNLIVNIKIKDYIKQRYSNLGLKKAEIQNLFPDEY